MPVGCGCKWYLVFFLTFCGQLLFLVLYKVAEARYLQTCTLTWPRRQAQVGLIWFLSHKNPSLLAILFCSIFPQTSTKNSVGDGTVLAIIWRQWCLRRRESVYCSFRLVYRDPSLSFSPSLSFFFFVFSVLPSHVAWFVVADFFLFSSDHIELAVEGRNWKRSSLHLYWHRYAIS